MGCFAEIHGRGNVISGDVHSAAVAPDDQIPVDQLVQIAPDRRRTDLQLLTEIVNGAELLLFQEIQQFLKAFFLQHKNHLL
jgi:hypothetical protein